MSRTSRGKHDLSKYVERKQTTTKMKTLDTGLGTVAQWCSTCLICQGPGLNSRTTIKQPKNFIYKDR